MFRPLFCENSSPLQCFAKILALFSAVAKCLGNLSENAKYLGNLFQKNGLEIEDRKSRKSKVAKYSKILADLPSEQIFTEITRLVPLLKRVETMLNRC